MAMAQGAAERGAAGRLGLAGCGEGPWNNPYPPAEGGRNVLYSSFAERPKHLDPVRAYSSDEYEFIAQIYEPPLQYHYLKRPYELTPLTAEAIPHPRYLDAAGNPLPDEAPAEAIAFSEYEIKLLPGLRYQPHPALARDGQGNYRYHRLAPSDIERLHTLADLPETGTREVTAQDYLYQIKRQAAPWLHCPIGGLMEEYVVGFKGFGEQVGAAYDALKESLGQERPFLDLRAFELEGVQALDERTLRIRLHGKYPQFVYWLAMPFFAPVP
jgi:oligopeptide transport system substrate-binding protein